MQKLLKPHMSPAEEQRDYREKVKRETTLQRQLQGCIALVDAIEAGKITRDSPRMTPRMLQQTFSHVEDRNLTNGVVGQVLGIVGIFPGSGYTVHPEEIIDQQQALSELVDTLRSDLTKVRRQLGRE